MPLKYFDRTTQGEVLSRITNDVDTVNQTFSQSLTQIITSFVTVVGCADHDVLHQLADDPGGVDRDSHDFRELRSA
jgi:ABC-type siderophore export system fused ATPase/permease subunit